MWESAVEKVLNRQFADAVPQRQCNAQAVTVTGVARIYACGSSISLRARLFRGGENKRTIGRPKVN